MSAIANVVIVIEPGNHEFEVQPMVANFVHQCQRERVRAERERDNAAATVVRLEGELAELRAYAGKLAEANGEVFAVARELPESPK